MKHENFLKENNARHFWHPMAHPAEMLETPPMIISKASGVEVEDIDGHKMLDAVGGLWNVNLGYSCQPIKEAITKQLEKMPYCNTFRGITNDKAITPKIAPIILFFDFSDILDQKCIVNDTIRTTPSPIMIYFGIILY